MPTNPLAVIDRYYAELNDTERQVADYVRTNTVDASRWTIDVVAGEIGVSKSNLVRFAQKIGYTGYAQFKHELASFLLSHQSATDELPQSAAARVTNTYIDYLRQMGNGLDDREVDELAALICSSDRILIAGYERGSHGPMQLNKRLMNVGIRSQATSELYMLHNSFDLYTPDDLLIIFSVADGTKQFSNDIPAIAESGIKIACITCTQVLPFKKLCRSYITLPRVSRDPNVMFLDDQATFYVFIEILIDAVAKRMAAVAED